MEQHDACLLFVFSMCLLNLDLDFHLYLKKMLEDDFPIIVRAYVNY